MYDYFFTLPYAIFGAPALMLLSLMIAGLLFGSIDFDLDADLDADLDSGVSPSGISALLISAGISKVPLMIGLTVTFWVGHLISSVIYDNLLTALLPEMVSIYAHVALSIPYFVVSLYIAGAILEKPFAKMNEHAEVVVEDIVGMSGYANTTITTRFGQATVNVTNGSTTFIAVPKDDIEIPISSTIRVIKELTVDENGNSTYLIERSD
ncbi:membrane hypothetical protein [Vibrio chagasii]|nr:membrane hypothetical protein [Vibrio chagasii]